MTRFIIADRDTAYLLPPSLDEWLPQEHLARFVVEVVDQLDLTELTKQYAGRGSKAVINDRAAGIDIGSRFHVVAVPTDLAEQSVRTFKAFTADLECMAKWLTDVGVNTAAMESTGVYWIPVYENRDQQLGGRVSSDDRATTCEGFEEHTFASTLVAHA